MLPAFDHYIQNIDPEEYNQTLWLSQQVQKMKTTVEHLYSLIELGDSANLKEAISILTEYAHLNHQLLLQYNQTHNPYILREATLGAEVINCACTAVSKLSQTDTQRCVSPIKFVGR